MFLLILTLITYTTASQVYFQGIELLSDVNYSQYFSGIPACSSSPTECVKAPRYRIYNPFSTTLNKSASWQIAQWASHSNLSTNGTLIEDEKSKGMQWSTVDKRFIIFQDGRLQMVVNGYHEYDGQYEPLDAPWIHLLIQQDIGITGGSVPLSQINELRWNLDVQLLYMNQHIQPRYDPNLHGGIFPLYMTIQNLIQGDPEYGKYFWLGICLYDDRVLMSSSYVNGDIDTGSLIYSPAFSNFANISVHSERMNIGWEVTGLNNGTIEIGNLSLKQYTAQNPKSYEFNCDGDAEGWKQISDLRQYTDSSWNGI
ncbi:unnamed protein product [Rotaria sp. Silwood1]|nr:unnamed protein product [Rotaria sp. Silwood1]CAF1008637.1 unnamed protein product [Rotaria sp. Silwood1]CAF3413357.1 unnamed protein product [Rotaria sp. Silwood1]CAF3416840.1 unnamed protein product [Rotaria sp. Silwood1]CAF4590416.1 unnamed protein product [Rotaria sp. Silwood1]